MIFFTIFYQIKKKHSLIFLDCHTLHPVMKLDGYISFLMEWNGMEPQESPMGSQEAHSWPSEYRGSNGAHMNL